MIKVFARGNAAAEVEIYAPIGENWYGDGLTAKRFRDDLKALGNVTDITVRINSPGGEVFDGFSIYNALKEHPAKVTVYIDGLAASIASVIAMAGDQVYMGEGAMFMVHSPWTLAMGDAENMRQTADMLDKISVGLVDAYVAGTGQDRAAVEGWMTGETWFTRDEAIAAGLADGISATASTPSTANSSREKWAASLQFQAFAASLTNQRKSMSKTRRIVAVAPTITTEALDPMKVGVEFSQQLAATGEDPTWSGTPPAGLTLSDSGLLEGTPTESGAYAFTVTASNADGSEDREYNGSVDPADDETTQEDDNMTTENSSATAAADRNKVLAAETARREAIRARFGRHAEANRVLLDACLDDVNCTADLASQKLLAKLGEGIDPLRPAAAMSVSITADSRDKFIAGAKAALAAKAGVGKREEGNEFNGDTLADLASKALVLGGESVRGLTRDAIARKVLAFHTSSDFPSLLSSTAGKVLRSAYENFPNTWNLWAAKGSVSDFKIAPRIQLGSFNALATIPEGGEYTYGSLAEEYENAQALTKGKALALTRQIIVNDDLGGFTRRAQLMGRAAARSVNTDAYAYLTSGGSNLGPTCTDTGQFFNATAVTTAGGHANYTSSGTAISVASLGVGRVAMRKQKDKGLTETLNIEPAILLCSVAKEDLARQVIVSETDPASANSKVPNIYRNRFEVVSDPYLDGIAANPWFLFSNPADVAAFEVVFLDGNESPFIDEAVDFDTDAMKFKVRLDYGVATGDWRGGYKNAGG